MVGVGGPSGRREGDYGTARVASALTLIAVVVFIMVVDALSTEYEASPIIVTALLAGAGSMLGVEVAAALNRRRDI